MQNTRQVPVTERAVVQRVNRKLAAERVRLHKCRDGGRWESQLGTWYVVDLDVNGIAQTHVDLETYARELDVLAAWEAVEHASQLPHG